MLLCSSCIGVQWSTMGAAGAACSQLPQHRTQPRIDACSKGMHIWAHRRSISVPPRSAMETGTSSQPSLGTCGAAMSERMQLGH